MPKLYVYPKKQDPFQVDLQNNRISVGRSADNDISIPDPFISGHHAFIFPVEEGYAVRDNNSKNKTFLNGKKIVAGARLQKGDDILIGSTRIIFDKPLSTNVEITDADLSSAPVNTILHLQEILKKPAISTTIRAAAIPFDVEKIKAEHQAFSVLSEVSQALIIHIPLSELLEHIMDLITQALPMDRGILMLKEGHPPQYIPKVARIINKDLKHKKIQVCQSIVNMAVDNHSSILTSDAQADPRFLGRESVIKLNIHSAMCVPLWNNKDIIGIVYSDRISMLEQFTEDDLKLLTLLSNLAAVKIENSKLTEMAIEKEKMMKELALAAQIQKDFLPKKIPESKNFEIYGTNFPCQQVGGDYFDYLDIDDDRLGITIADVSGKGVSASLIMASLRAAIHSEVHPEYDIKRMAAKLNDFVHRSSAPNCFITFFFGELNKKTGDLKYINAGHNPPLIIGKKREIQRLESCGLCLGMFPSSSYEPETIALSPGDMAFLYTDGIVECRNKKNEEFGEDRLIKFLQKNLNLSAKELQKKIYKELSAFTSGADQMDDMTLLVIKKTAD